MGHVTGQRVIVLALTAALVLAGCLGTTTDDETAPGDAPSDALHWSTRATEDAHDHTDVTLHRNITTPNFEVVGYSPLIGEHYNTTAPGNLCGDARSTGNGTQLAAVESRGDLAFTLADVSDPANPAWLGEFAMPTTYVYDLTLLPDGEHVALVTTEARQPDQTPGLPLPADGKLEVPADRSTPPILYRSACAPGGWDAWHAVDAARDDVGQIAGQQTGIVPRAFSLVLVSIEDPAAPEIVDQRPLTVFGHSVNAATVDGRQVVIASSLTCLPEAGCPHQAATFDLYGLVDDPTGATGAKLELLSRWQPPIDTMPSPDEPYKQMGHNDAWVGEHPITGDTLAYLVAWDAGLYILDISDPSSPEQVGHFSDHDPDNPGEGSGNTHSAYPMDTTLDGRHYTAIGPENGQAPPGKPAGVIRVLDTTDPTSPRETAAWVLPHNVTFEEPFQWSPHYLGIQGTTLFVSHYHTGVWALPLDELDGTWTELAAEGVFLPTRTSPAPPEDPFRWTPTTEEVLPLPDGTLVTFDSNSGLYTFGYDASVETTPAPAWGVEPAHPDQAR